MTVKRKNIVTKLTKSILKLFATPTMIQVGALCYLDIEVGNPNSRKVLLITSRKGGRWIFPKGNVKSKKSHGQTALEEAHEEAGVIGIVSEQPIDIVDSTKNLGEGYRQPLKLHIYEIEVTSIDENFREKGQREITWLPIPEAIERCDEEALSYLLKKWAANKT